jgi:hypothetical protein
MENYEPIVPLHLVNAEYNDFIGVYKNFVSADLCDEIVEKFDERLNISVSTNDVWKSDKQFAGAKLGKLGRSDTCLLLETFDKNLTEVANVNFGNFAILRPKPDETSVIIDYQKDPGEVSQTLLIPGDTNQLLKDKTGDIFEYYNPRLNPSTQT